MLNDLKDLEKFLKICRKQGVTDITLNGVSVKLVDRPLKQNEEIDDISTPDDLIGDQLIYYAVNNGAAQ